MVRLHGAAPLHYTFSLITDIIVIIGANSPEPEPRTQIIAGGREGGGGRCGQLANICAMYHFYSIEDRENTDSAG